VGRNGTLRYRAGEAARRRIRDEGLNPETVGCVAGPASGPKWLVLAGVDRALIESGLATAPRGERRRLLVGSSAGAWRMLALAASRPLAVHAGLLRGYVHQVFPRGVRSSRVSAAYRRMLDDVFPAEEVRHVLGHPAVDLGLHVTCVPGLPRRASRWRHVPMLGAIGALHAVAPAVARGMMRRVLFHSRPPAFEPAFDGRLAPLTAENLPAAALATGTVPVHMDPVPSIPGGPPGPFVDGGLADYHLRQRYVASGDGITLFPHFQRDVLAVWFDRHPPRRRPDRQALDNVLQLYPSREFVATLPGGKLPDRDDFFTFVDDPDERIRRWSAIAAESERLGETFSADLEAGRIPDLLEPLARPPSGADS
jgi:hypothetical protein